MAYDDKQLKTFKWLQDLANNRHAYAKDFINSTPYIYVYCESIYATDSVILADISYNYPQVYTNYEWGKIEQFTDAGGFLLEEPVVTILERQFNDHRFFSKFFDTECSYPDCSFDTRVVKQALKVVEINKISPVICSVDKGLCFMGHNHDISIRVLAMGEGR